MSDTPWTILTGHSPQCDCWDCLAQDAEDAEAEWRQEAEAEARSRCET